MGTFVSDPSEMLFEDKSPAPGITLPGGWTPANVTDADDLNGLRDAAYDLRTAHYALNTELAALASVASIAALKALTAPVVASARPVVVNVRGYYASADGGGGLFHWDSASSATDDGGTIIALDAGGTGRWKRIIPGGAIQAEWFGYVEGQSAATVTAAFQRALAYIKTTEGRLEYPPGAFTHSDEVGTDQMNAADLANNVELHFRGTHITYAPVVAPISGVSAIVLEGNNIKVTGSLTLDSNHPKDWEGDLPSQREFYSGLTVGGKSNRRLTPVLGHYTRGVLIEGVKVTNFDDPFNVYAAGDVEVRNCTVEHFTSTGILIDDCTDNIKVHHNTVRYGGDDCFYARHYATTPWAIAGNYIGNIELHHNTLTDCFAKSFGFGGYSDVDAHSNFSKNVWYCGANIEYASWATSGGKRIKIRNNIFIDSARAYDPDHPVATYQLPPVDTTVTCAISTSYTAGSVVFEDIEITGNTIVNPDQSGIYAFATERLKISGNTIIAGRTTKDAVNRDSDGSGIAISGCQDVSVTDNQILGNGSQSWKWCYDVNDDASTERIDIRGNGREHFLNDFFRGISATCVAQVNYEGGGLRGQSAWAPGAISDGDGVTVNFALSGASLGDLVQATFTQDLQGLTIAAWVQSANVISVRFQNETGGSVSLTAGTIKAKVTKQR